MTIDEYIAKHFTFTPGGDNSNLIEGWCSPEKARALYESVKKHQPWEIVEIGVFGGRSLFAMALASRTGARVIGIDPWDSVESVSGWAENDANHGWWKSVDHQNLYNKTLEWRNNIFGETWYVELLRATSAQALPQIPPKIDFLHIDGNHAEEKALFDVANYVTRVPKGGQIWLDDINWSTTQAAQKLLCTMAKKTGEISGEGGVCGIYEKLGLCE